MLSASKIFIKKSFTPGVSPSASQLEYGELAINLADKKIFFKDTDDNVSFLEQTPYTNLSILSSIVSINGNNTVSGVYSNALGGYNNDISGSGSTTINGENNDVSGDFAVIVNGLNNTISVNGDYGVILGGKSNTLNHQESFIIGSNITSHLSGLVYVNNLSATGKVYGDGSELTGIVAGDTEATTLVRTNSGYWDSVYNTVQSNSATNWSYRGTDLKALSANWEDAYSYVSSTSASLVLTSDSRLSDSRTPTAHKTTHAIGGSDVLTPADIGAISNTTFNSVSGNWQSTYTTVLGQSAQWASNVDVGVRALTGNWDSTYTTVNSNSANWQSTYTTVQANSATTWNYQGTDLKNLSSNWESTYTTVYSNSASWTSSTTTTSATQFLARVANADSVNLNRGDVVYTFGAIGDVMSVKKASNTSDLTSARTLGFVNETKFCNTILQKVKKFVKAIFYRKFI